MLSVFVLCSVGQTMKRVDGSTLSGADLTKKIDVLMEAANVSGFRRYHCWS